MFFVVSFVKVCCCVVCVGIHVLGGFGFVSFRFFFTDLLMARVLYTYMHIFPCVV